MDFCLQFSVQLAVLFSFLSLGVHLVQGAGLSKELISGLFFASETIFFLLDTPWRKKNLFFDEFNRLIGPSTENCLDFLPLAQVVNKENYVDVAGFL